MAVRTRACMRGSFTTFDEPGMGRSTVGKRGIFLVSAKVLRPAPRGDFSGRSQSASEFLNKATSPLTGNT